MQKKTKDKKQNWISVLKYYLNQKSIAHLFLERKSFSRLFKKIEPDLAMGFYGQAPNHGWPMFEKHHPF